MAKAIYLCLFLLSLFISGCIASTERAEDLPLPSVLVVEEQAMDINNTQRPLSTSNIDQIHNEYSINLSVNPETGVIKGNQKVSYINKSNDELKEICFNIPLNAFSINSAYQPFFAEFRSKVFSEGPDYGYVNITGAMSGGIDVMYHVNSTKLYVYLDTPLSAGKKCDVSIQFESYIPIINHRTGSSKDSMWMGAFLPYLAVYENGNFRFDTYYAAGDPIYSETANYNVNITAPSRYRIVGPGIESVREEGDIKITSFSAKLVRDFSFAVLERNYSKYSARTESGVEINFYYRLGLSNPENFVYNAIEAFDFFEDYIGRYPYTKLDIVETGFFLTGATEFSQIVFVDKDFLLEPNGDKKFVREIGHQWFYNITGSDQINSAWMDEGIVSLLMDKMTYADFDEYIVALKCDYEELSERLPGYIQVKLSDSIADYESWDNYYDIQYIKGKLMLFSLNIKLGEEKFNEFVRTYFSSFSYKLARPDDFISLAEEVYGNNLSGFFDSWLNEEELPYLY